MDLDDIIDAIEAEDFNDEQLTVIIFNCISSYKENASRVATILTLIDNMSMATGKSYKEVCSDFASILERYKERKSGNEK